MLKITLSHYFMVLCFKNITVCAELLVRPRRFKVPLLASFRSLTIVLLYMSLALWL